MADGVRFAFLTGWRQAEVFIHTWPQVDWNGGFVRLEPGTTKNQEGRAFPITPALRTILERRQGLTRRCERAQARIIPLVFHRSGDPILSFRRSWKEACKKAGIPDLLFHDLRRSAVRNLERARGYRDHAMAIPREVFDRVLLDRARSLPIEVRERHRVIALTIDGDQVTGVVGADGEGRPLEVTSRLVVGADGRASIVARSLGLVRPHRVQRLALIHRYRLRNTRGLLG